MAGSSRWELDADQKTVYLHNVARMAAADNVMAPAEDALLEEVRKSIGATKTQLKHALQEGGTPQLELDALPTVSWRVRNVEHMLELAMADGTLSDVEKSLLSDAAASAGLTQSLVSLLVSEARERIRSACPTCQKCGASATPGAKFCPSCGIDLKTASASAATKLELTIPPAGFTVAFADSTAAGFPAALSVAKSHPSFQQASRAGRNWYAVTFDSPGHPELINLVEGLKGMRNREVYVAGELKQWDSVFGWTWCYKQRSAAYYAARWCFGLEDGSFNPWGCRMLQMDLHTWGTDWLCYGHFADRSTFVFDKERIRYELGLGIEALQLCPCLNQRLIEAVLRRLPDRVTVGKGKWDYQETYQPDPEAIKVVRTHRYGSLTETEEFYAKGVTLKDTRWALTLLASALKDVGGIDVDLRKLTGS